jgi:uncharacterized coiled-coil protein SlyX
VFFQLFGVEYMSDAPETDKKIEPAVSSKPSSRKTIVAFASFALVVNGAAAICTLPSFDIALPDVNNFAELFSHEAVSVPIPEAVTAALDEFRSTQQQTLAAIQENGSSLQLHTSILQQNTSVLQQNTALLQRGATTLDSLKQGQAAEQTDVKKISAQLSALTAKFDALQSAVAPDITSSIPRGRGRNRLSALARKKMARSAKPVGPVSVGGAPLTTAPAALEWSSQQSPDG